MAIAAIFLIMQQARERQRLAEEARRIRREQEQAKNSRQNGQR